jgi:hypothetical protein
MLKVKEGRNVRELRFFKRSSGKLTLAKIWSCVFGLIKYALNENYLFDFPQIEQKGCHVKFWGESKTVLI